MDYWNRFFVYFWIDKIFNFKNIIMSLENILMKFYFNNYKIFIYI